MLPLGLRALLLAVSIGLVGCHRAPRARFPGAEQLFERLQRQSSCSRAVAGEAQLQLKGPFVDVKGTLLFKAQAPDRLRFDLYSPLGVTLSTLTTRGDTFSLYDLASRRFVHGPSSACNLARFTRVLVPPPVLVELLRGRPGIVEHEPDEARFRFARPWFADGKYVVVLEGEHQSRQWLTVRVPREDYDLPWSEQRLHLERVVVKQAGKLVYEVELSDYRAAERAPNVLSPEEKEMGIASVPSTGPECSAELPHQLSFNVGRGGYRLELSAKELWHNPPDVPASYTQQPPSGVRTEFSDCALP